jgi:hypothetical protein
MGEICIVRLAKGRQAGMKELGRVKGPSTAFIIINPLKEVPPFLLD